MYKGRITHTGTVVGLSGRCVSVRLNLKADGGDCGACALSTVCRPDGSKSPETELIVPVYVPTGSPLPAVGDVVELASKPYGTGRATMLLLVVPLLVFLIIAVGGTVMELNQALTGIAALVGALLVFPVIFLLRRGGKSSLWNIVHSI